MVSRWLFASSCNSPSASDNAVGNRKTITSLTDASAELSDALGELQDEANNQRDTMISLREKIDANQRRVADELFKL